VLIVIGVPSTIPVIKDVKGAPPSKDIVNLAVAAPSAD